MPPAPEEPAFPLVDEEAEPASISQQVGLCLSGGGYRAMLFHVGVLWRLHEMGWLPRLDRISSVSGGSITAGVLATRWAELLSATSSFDELVARPLRGLAGRTVDVRALAKGLLPGTSVGRQVEAALAAELFGETTLGMLAEQPAFTFHATNVSTGKLVRFDRERVSDWRIGSVSSKEIPLASAVTASASFPPVLSPYRLDTSQLTWRKDGSGTLPDADAYQKKLTLTDGGVYDNLGLESVWSQCSTVLVSDGGGQLKTEPGADGDWIRHFIRTTKVIDHQVRSLRIRQIQTAFNSEKPGTRTGTHIGIRTKPEADHKPDGHLPVTDAAAKQLAAVPTRLKRLSSRDQERLINWGYAIADIKMRSHVDRSAAPPERYPYAGGIG